MNKIQWGCIVFEEALLEFVIEAVVKSRFNHTIRRHRPTYPQSYGEYQTVPSWVGKRSWLDIRMMQR
jgi:hypothetical protein